MHQLTLPLRLVKTQPVCVRVFNNGTGGLSVYLWSSTYRAALPATFAEEQIQGGIDAGPRVLRRLG